MCIAGVIRIVVVKRVCNRTAIKRSISGRRRSIGVLGSSINIASRVEQSTKEHPYKVIFTKFLLDSLLKTIPKTHQIKFNRFWNDLDKHRLRGFDSPLRLYAFKPGFHKAWEAASIQIPQAQCRARNRKENLP